MLPLAPARHQELQSMSGYRPDPKLAGTSLYQSVAVRQKTGRNSSGGRQALVERIVYESNSISVHLAPGAENATTLGDARMKWTGQPSDPLFAFDDAPDTAAGGNKLNFPMRNVKRAASIVFALGGDFEELLVVPQVEDDATNRNNTSVGAGASAGADSSSNPTLLAGASNV